MAECMTFPDTVEEYMEQYKIVDTEQIYTNGIEMIPLFRMKQWFEHMPERKTGKWIPKDDRRYYCSLCNGIAPKGYRWDYCPNCGAKMEGEQP